MAVLIDGNTRLLVQGITGKASIYHTQEALDIGTNVVAGVSLGKGGQEVLGIPVYDSVQEAMAEKKPEASLLMLPARATTDAAFEAIANGVKLVIIVAEGVPVHDTMKMIRFAREKGARVVGPSTPGILSPGKAKAGLMPVRAFMLGPVGIISRSGTLSYETAKELTSSGLGQSTFVGLGGDMVRGTSFVDVLKLMNEDVETKGIVLIGEIGGNQEETAAKYIGENPTKPVVAFIAGKGAKPGRRMGHAGAIVMGGVGTYEEKVQALNSAGVEVADSPAHVARLMKARLV